MYYHPIQGTPEIIEYGEEDQKLILIEEYISGESLSDKIQNADLTKEQILKYMTDLCEIVDRCTKMTPSERYRSVAELEAELWKVRGQNTKTKVRSVYTGGRMKKMNHPISSPE